MSYFVSFWIEKNYAWTSDKHFSIFFFFIGRNNNRKKLRFFDSSKCWNTKIVYAYLFLISFVEVDHLNVHFGIDTLSVCREWHEYEKKSYICFCLWLVWVFAQHFFFRYFHVSSVFFPFVFSILLLIFTEFIFIFIKVNWIDDA